MGTKIEYNMKNKPTYDEIDVSKLLLDECNPRLPKSKHNMDEQEIINFLLLEAATLELMQAIGENDFFQGEQLLVIPTENGKYKVLEGNRRLVAVKLLNNPDLAQVKKVSVKEVFESAKYKPTLIPCLIFEVEADVRKYLGFRHITGIKPWGLSEKARYLYQLYLENFHDFTLDSACRELAKIIGSRRDYVKRVIVAFSLYKKVEDEDFYGIRDLNDSTFYIGYLADSLNHTNISKFLGVNFSHENPEEKLNLKNLKTLVHWFFEKNDQNKTRLKGKSSDLNKLNSILNTEKSNLALKAFSEEGKSLEAAYEFTEDTDSIFLINIRNALQKLEVADSVTHRVNVFYDGLDEDLIQIRKLTSKIKQTKDEFNKGEFGDDEKF